MSTIILIAIYLLVAMGTAIFNVAILAYVEYPLVIVRNALLWPICLPMIVIWWMTN